MELPAHKDAEWDGPVRLAASPLVEKLPRLSSIWRPISNNTRRTNVWAIWRCTRSIDASKRRRSCGAYILVHSQHQRCPSRTPTISLNIAAIHVGKYASIMTSKIHASSWNDRCMHVSFVSNRERNASWLHTMDLDPNRPQLISWWNQRIPCHLFTQMVLFSLRRWTQPFSNENAKYPTILLTANGNDL